MWVRADTALTNDAFAANEVVVLSHATELEFTNTDATGVGYSNGGSFGAARANSACPESTSTRWYYCWVQVGGLATIKTNGDNDMVAGDGFIASGNGTANGVVTRPHRRTA